MENVDQTNTVQLHLDQIKSASAETAPWLKFYGIVLIIMGCLSILTLIGIVIAWSFIWLGILLLQAGNKAKDAQLSDNTFYIIEMMRKLKTYFIVSVILSILFLIYLTVIIITLFLPYGFDIFDQFV